MGYSRARSKARVYCRTGLEVILGLRWVILGPGLRLGVIVGLG